MKDKKNLKVAIIVVVLLLAAILIFIKAAAGKTANVSYQLDDDLVITEIENYKGAYMEDGSDRDVKNVAMIVVKNNGEKTLQYGRVEISFGDAIAEFSFSTLTPGSEMVVLEAKGLEYPGKKDLGEPILTNAAYFEEGISLCEDTIQIQPLEGALNIRNISGKDISGQVAVYYKTVKDGIYQGGITYRALVKDGMKPDEIRQVMTNHFSLDSSEIMFVTYVE